LAFLAYTHIDETHASTCTTKKHNKNVQNLMVKKVHYFPSLSPFLFLSLRSKTPEIQLKGLGSTVSSPNEVWGRASAEIEFSAF